jgi:hypothetical protein
MQAECSVLARRADAIGHGEAAPLLFWLDGRGVTCLLSQAVLPRWACAALGCAYGDVVELAFHGSETLQSLQ